MDYSQTKDGNKIPDGGLKAWLQVLGSWCIFVCTWGLITAYGSFQTYYETEALPNESPSSIAWIGSIQGFLLLLGCPIAGRLMETGYLRFLLAVGSLLIFSSLLLTSFATQYWHFVLVHGVMFGLGCGMINMPSVGILPKYFLKSRALAQGLAASGSSLGKSYRIRSWSSHTNGLSGGLVFPIIYHFGQERIGFQWTTRLVSLITLLLLTTANLTIRLPHHKVKVVMQDKDLAASRTRVSFWRSLQDMMDLQAFADIGLSSFMMAGFLAFMGVYVAFTYVESAALDLGIVGDDLAFYLLPLANGASTLGRILPNIVADRTGPLPVMFICGVISSLSVILWIAASSFGIGAGEGIIVTFCIVYGFFTGPFVALIPIGFAVLVDDPAVLSKRMGTGFGVMGIGFLIGTPVAGAVLGTGGWLPLQIYNAVLILSCALFIACAMLSRALLPCCGPRRRLAGTETSTPPLPAPLLV